MCDTINDHAKCEVRSVIRFLNAKKVRPIEIYRQINEVYGDVMNEASVRKWCIMFNGGRTNVHDEERSGRPSVVTDELKRRIEEKIQEDRRFTIDGLSLFFPEISRTVLYTIVSEDLAYKKVCARWVPRILTDEHKQKRMGAALTFLIRYDKDGEQFLNHIVTGDETWISHITPESKRQSMEWHHSRSPTKPKKAKQILSTRKVMATVFWDRKGVLLVDYMPRGETINAAAYCQTLHRLRRAIQNKRRGLLSSGVVLLHDNARPHAAVMTTNLLQKFKWELFEHPPYSPDLAPSDFHLFPKLKDFLGGSRYGSDDELKEGVNEWLNNLAATEYAEGIEKLVKRYDKCLNLNGDYVEK